MECYSCGEDYKRLSLHWRRGSCDYPTLTDHQRELVKGLVMGDGYVKRRENSPCQVRAEMTNRTFLEAFHDALQPLSASVKDYRTAKENAERNGCDTSYGYSDSYHYISRTAPTFNEFGEWYSGGKKVWPEDLELTPASLAILYVCDGTLDGRTPSISCVKEMERPEYVESLFENLGIEASMTGHHVRLDPQQFFETVGGPVAGFEEKWNESFMTDEAVLENTR